MKKLFTLTAICILSAIILSSCGSGLSITKRRYSKGFYVNRTPKHHDTKEIQSNTAKTEALALTPVQVVPELKKETSTTTRSFENNGTENRNVLAAVNQTQNKGRATAKTKSPMAAAFADFSVKTPVKSIDKAIQTSRLNAGDEDGLSLFWIVILILLILWALGFISGNFGAIINVLLIIALILLILWLLRVL